MVAEGLRKIGIEMKLELMDYNALMKKVSERQFVLHSQAWRGILFPNPLTSWHSKLANESYNNNISGFASEEVDRLMEAYDKTFDLDEQTQIMQEIDGLIFKEHPVALSWYGPFERVLSWNRFGVPGTVITRTDDSNIIWSLWWTTPELNERLKKARENGTSLPQVPDVFDPWGVKERMESAEKASE